MHPKNVMPETNYIRLKEEASFGRRRLGAVLVTVGKILLWMDLLLLIFVYVGYRSGSTFWLWWVVIEAVLGAVLLVIGLYRRAHGSAPSR
jgi:hypothetical protein